MDKAGRRWEMGTYAEMATLTALSRASVSGYTDTMGKYGYDLAIISAHADACPICAAWQGVIVSVSGKDGRYPSLDDAYAAGVFHPRCIHHLSIWHEGITHGAARGRPGRVEPPSPGYTARSRQRQCERMVRRYKRRQARAMVSKWQGEVRRTIAEAPGVLTRHYEREGGRVNLSEAARKIRLNKTRKGDIIITDKQFGRKAGKHMIEWGLDPSDQKDRERFLDMIHDIVEHRDEVRRVPWKVNPQTKKRDVDVNAYIKERDVVLLDDDGVFVTAMKDGIENRRVQSGKKVE